MNETPCFRGKGKWGYCLTMGSYFRDKWGGDAAVHHTIFRLPRQGLVPPLGVAPWVSRGGISPPPTK